MQILGPHLGSADSESAFWQDPYLIQRPIKAGEHGFSLHWSFMEHAWPDFCLGMDNQGTVSQSTFQTLSFFFLVGNAWSTYHSRPLGWLKETMQLKALHNGTALHQCLTTIAALHNHLWSLKLMPGLRLHPSCFSRFVVRPAIGTFLNISSVDSNGSSHDLAVYSDP